MKFSLILTSFERHNDLDMLFSSLVGQTYLGEIEIIFVNQGKTYDLKVELPNNVTLKVIECE